MAARIKIGIAPTINVGNFNSFKPMIEYDDEVQPGETVDAAYARIRAEAERLFIQEFRHQLDLFPKIKEKAQSVLGHDAK